MRVDSLVCVVVVSYQEYSLTHTAAAVCFFAGERATQAPIVRGGEGEARAFRRPRSRGKRHVAH